MRDQEYINIQKTNNDSIWRSGERELYYSYKNDEYIVPTILICSFLIFCKWGIISIIFVLLFVRYLCMYNNNELDNSPIIQEKRESYKEYRKNRYK